MQTATARIVDDVSLPVQASNAVVRIRRDYLGRGPTRARAFLHGNVLVVLTEDNLTKAERRLMVDGEAETVRSLRRKFQETMRTDLVDAVEALTGCRVVSLMSDLDPVTDRGAEVFVLDCAPTIG